MIIISGIEELIYLIADLALLVILILFFSSTLKQYLSNKKKSALYLLLVYLFYIIAFILQSIVSFYNYLDTTDMLYNLLQYQFTIFVVLAAIALLLFYNEFEPISKKLLNPILVVGVILIVWMIIAFNVLRFLQFTIYFSFLLLTIYSGIIYLYTGSKFFRIAAKSGSNQGLYFGIANICFFSYEIVKIIFVFIELFIINLIAIILIFLAFLLYFLALYMPKFRSS